jgi:hypothetical protein
MTHALMIPATRATTTLRNVAAVAAAVEVEVEVEAEAEAAGTKTARGIMTVGTAIMTGAHANTKEGMDVNHGITIAAMMIGDTEL